MPQYPLDASTQQVVEVPLTMPNSHPIIVAHRGNEEMQAWEAMVLVGNFRTEADAIAAAAFLREMCAREFGAKMRPA